MGMCDRYPASKLTHKQCCIYLIPILCSVCCSWTLVFAGTCFGFSCVTLNINAKSRKSSCILILGHHVLRLEKTRLQHNTDVAFGYEKCSQCRNAFILSKGQRGGNLLVSKRSLKTVCKLIRTYFPWSIISVIGFLMSLSAQLLRFFMSSLM